MALAPRTKDAKNANMISTDINHVYRQVADLRIRQCPDEGLYLARNDRSRGTLAVRLGAGRE
jgi:hypothetical protein